MWTWVTENRSVGWLNDSAHARFREMLLHTCHRYDLVCPAYVLMPDHLHLLLLGVSERSDQKKASVFFRTHFRPLPFRWQKQPYDHVLREEERVKGSFQRKAHYILDNPVRKSLVETPGDWSWEGCLLPGYPNLGPHRADYWKLFWELYWKARIESDSNT